jgi:Cd2+/Zn2+-exporting ATPase
VCHYLAEISRGRSGNAVYMPSGEFSNWQLRRAKGNIKALLDNEPDEVTILENDKPKTGKAETGLGSIIN